jgi:hypothetical protein
VEYDQSCGFVFCSCYWFFVDFLPDFPDHVSCNYLTARMSFLFSVLALLKIKNFQGGVSPTNRNSLRDKMFRGGSSFFKGMASMVNLRRPMRDVFSSQILDFDSST